jgi:hypothetical protein
MQYVMPCTVSYASSQYMLQKYLLNLSARRRLKVTSPILICIHITVGRQTPRLSLVRCLISVFIYALAYSTTHIHSHDCETGSYALAHIKGSKTWSVIRHGLQYVYSHCGFM